MKKRKKKNLEKAREVLNGNIGPGGFSDQYDNDSMKSVDRDSNPGGVTDVPFEDDWSLLDDDFFPDHGEAYTERSPPGGRS